MAHHRLWRIDNPRADREVLEPEILAVVDDPRRRILVDGHDILIEDAREDVSPDLVGRMPGGYGVEGDLGGAVSAGAVLTIYTN